MPPKLAIYILQASTTWYPNSTLPTPPSRIRLWNSNQTNAAHSSQPCSIRDDWRVQRGEHLHCCTTLAMRSRNYHHFRRWKIIVLDYCCTRVLIFAPGLHVMALQRPTSLFYFFQSPPSFPNLALEVFTLGSRFISTNIHFVQLVLPEYKKTFQMLESREPLSDCRCSRRYLWRCPHRLDSVGWVWNWFAFLEQLVALLLQLIIFSL